MCLSFFFLSLVLCFFFFFYFFFFFFNDTATTEIYTLSLHDALPIWVIPGLAVRPGQDPLWSYNRPEVHDVRSEEHMSELQSPDHLVCRLLLEKKVSRNVDVGQTVAASVRAPTLFNIAQDLTKMQIDTSVAEVDIGMFFLNKPAPPKIYPFPQPAALPS